MDKPILTTSSVFAVALAATAVASPAAASTINNDAALKAPAKIAVDSLGNLMIAGLSSDEALARTYGLSGKDAELAASDVNIGKCTVTNNCACGNQA